MFANAKKITFMILFKRNVFHVNVKKSRKSTPLFPMTAIILIACIGIFCGCGIICHNFRSHPELSNMNNAIRNRNHRYPRRRSNSASRQTNDHIITADSSETAGPSLLRAGSLSDTKMQSKDILMLS
ncbi:hypothetical protein SSS_01521 [Sarcoptes scabiei]|nr:hypothetical protein SSS_01521 [Sarcoptes scabiei]